MILQLLRQLNNIDRSKTIACSPPFCFALSLRFPCPIPKRISSRILSQSMFIPQNHPKSQQRVRTCAVIEKLVFRASLALSMLEIELYQTSLPYDRGRSGYEINRTQHPGGLNVDFEKVSARWKRFDFCFYLSVVLHAYFSVAFKPLMMREYATLSCPLYVPQFGGGARARFPNSSWKSRLFKFSGANFKLSFTIHPHMIALHNFFSVRADGEFEFELQRKKVPIALTFKFAVCIGVASRS